MTPVKVLTILFTLANAGQFFLMVKGDVGKTRLVRVLEKFNIEFDLFPGFVISILIFIVLIIAFFAFFNHYINYKEHYSSFLRFLICGNLFASILAVMLNFYLYFIKG